MSYITRVYTYTHVHMYTKYVHRQASSEVLSRTPSVSFLLLRYFQNGENQQFHYFQAVVLMPLTKNCKMMVWPEEGREDRKSIRSRSRRKKAVEAKEEVVEDKKKKRRRQKKKKSLPSPTTTERRRTQFITPTV